MKPTMVAQQQNGV